MGGSRDTSVSMVGEETDLVPDDGEELAVLEVGLRHGGPRY